MSTTRREEIQQLLYAQRGTVSSWVPAVSSEIADLIESAVREEVAIKVGLHWNHTSPGELTDAIVDLIESAVRDREQELLRGKVFNEVTITEKVHVPGEIKREIEREAKLEVLDEIHQRCEEDILELIDEIRSELRDPTNKQEE